MSEAHDWKNFDVIVHASYCIDGRVAHLLTCNPAKLHDEDAANERRFDALPETQR